MNDAAFAEIIRNALTMQLEAALATLRYCIDSCPVSEWESPPGESPFCQVVFHTLLYTDLYLGKDSIPFRDQTFHVEHRDVFADYGEIEDKRVRRLYDRQFCADYYAHCRRKLESVMQSETAESLRGRSGISFRKGSRMELHIYNARHIQHHSEQLGSRLQLLTGTETPWFMRGYRGAGE